MMNRKKPFRPSRASTGAPRSNQPARRRDEADERAAPRKPDVHRDSGLTAPLLAEEAADDVFDAQVPADDASGPQLVRLNKYLADHGVASRRRCDELIQAGQVSVDGEHVTELGLKVDPGRQVIEVDGVVLKPKDARKRYYVLNKPAGVVCTNEPRETRPRAVDLITDPYKGRIYTVGRLDEESKGLILVTNDGEFANKIMHPRYGIEKTYTVRVAGRIDDDSLTKIREGVHLSEGRTSGARILVDRRTNDASQLTVTIHEGMNREIRRVFARVGYKVTELRRVRIGPLTDRGLKPGRWRELLNREVDALLSGKNDTQEGPRGSTPGPRKRFPKKRGYARDFVRGGKLMPGAKREREPRRNFGARPNKPTGLRGPDARSGEAHPKGPRSDAPRFGGMRNAGKGEGRAGPTRFGGPRPGASRSNSSRPGSSRPHVSGPGASHGALDRNAPSGSRGPRRGGDRAGPSRGASSRGASSRGGSSRGDSGRGGRDRGSRR